MKKKSWLVILSVVIAICSCASTTTSVSFLCNQEDVEIWVNNNYVGNGLAHYTVSREVTTAYVECKKDGIVIFTRNYYIKGQNNTLFDINIPEKTYYSLDRQIHSK